MHKQLSVIENGIMKYMNIVNIGTHTNSSGCTCRMFNSTISDYGSPAVGALQAAQVLVGPHEESHGRPGDPEARAGSSSPSHIGCRDVQPWRV